MEEKRNITSTAKVIPGMTGVRVVIRKNDRNSDACMVKQ